ncbi:Tol-Pal system-associated acyl-CoA thioesterase [hydrothermal vent metagenome]|uniref:Tol-Pal system-associated acyl-CoA thioesterase n=1 Tax=hydrothermal vent metagenome TaxID=652676 RepID=A0A3B0RK02_9ZZZZ
MRQMEHAIEIPDNVQAMNGCFVDGRHYFAVRIYFEDTDFSGIVYHANYLRYMERARSDMLRLLGMDQNKAFDSGEGVYAVANLAIKYHLPAKLDDDLIVVSTVEKMRAASVIIDQTIMRRGSDQNPEIITSANIQVAFLNPQGRPHGHPKAWTETLNKVMTAAQDAENQED